jgi:hypothetical protein
LLHFWAAFLLSGPSLKSIGIAAAAATTSLADWSGKEGQEKKMRTTFAGQAGESLHIELRNEHQVALLTWQSRGCDWRHGSH